MERAYEARLQLEKELIVDQQYSYLETIVTIENNNQISVSPNRKNYSSIVDNRIQLNFSFQHFSISAVLYQSARK